MNHEIMQIKSVLANAKKENRGLSSEEARTIGSYLTEIQNHIRFQEEYEETGVEVLNRIIIKYEALFESISMIINNILENPVLLDDVIEDLDELFVKLDMKK